MEKVARAALEQFQPRKGEPMTYFRACSIAVLMCTLVIALGMVGMTKMLDTVAQLEHCRWMKCKEIWDKLEAGHDADNMRDALDEYMDPKDMRDGNSRPQLELTALRPSQYGQVDDLIQSNLCKKHLYITAVAVQDLLSAKMQIQVSVTTCKRILRRLGYRYGKVTRKYQLTRARKMRVRRFLREYARALQLEAAGTHIIVNIDESYCHTRHARSMGYNIDVGVSEKINNAYIHDCDDARMGDTTNSRGQRLILLHAVTKDGLLCDMDTKKDCRRHITSGTKVTAEYTSAEWVFQANAKIPDYHANMDGMMYQNWLEYILIPSFKAKYPNKKMILFQDNAPYHRAMGEGGIQVEGKTKASLIQYCTELGIEEVSVTRQVGDESNVVVFKSDVFEARGGPNAPTLKELGAAILAHAQEHCPQRLVNQTQKTAELYDFELLWGAPYCPKFAVIELLWAFAKNRVAWEYEPGRKVKELAEDVFNAFYGGTGRRSGKELCPFSGRTAKKFIARTHRAMNEWIALYGEEVKLSGTVADLKVGAVDDANDGALFEEGDDGDDVVDDDELAHEDDVAVELEE